MPHERADLYQDDLTDERGPTPAQRDEVAQTQPLDPDILDKGTDDAGETDGDDDEDDDADDEDEDLDE
jgi:hypothetical protein